VIHDTFDYNNSYVDIIDLMEYGSDYNTPGDPAALTYDVMGKPVTDD